MRPLLFLFGLALLPLAAACGGEGDGPSPAKTNAIVFAAGTGQALSDLFVVSADGANFRQLTSGEQVEGWPAWSPTGDRIAFLRIDARSELLQQTPSPELSERLGLLTIRPDGSEERALGKGAVYLAFGTSFGWSADGRRLAYSATEPAEDGVKGGIFVVDGSGGEPLHLVMDPSALMPAWSPGGKEIAFMSAGEPDESGSQEVEIALVQADGENIRQLVNRPGPDIAPAWSPDGRRIAWWGQDLEGPPNRLFVASMKEGELIELGTGSNPVWSPDGKKLAFTDEGADGDVEVLVVDVESGERTNLTNNPARDMWPTWSPDGKQIAFASDRDDERGEIYVMNSDGSEVRRLTQNDLAETMLAWSPR